MLLFFHLSIEQSVRTKSIVFRPRSEELWVRRAGRMISDGLQVLGLFGSRPRSDSSSDLLGLRARWAGRMVSDGLQALCLFGSRLGPDSGSDLLGLRAKWAGRMVSDEFQALCLFGSRPGLNSGLGPLGLQMGFTIPIRLSGRVFDSGPLAIFTP